MRNVFPVLMGGIGKDIIATCVKHYDLGRDLAPSDLTL